MDFDSVSRLPSAFSLPPSRDAVWSTATSNDLASLKAGGKLSVNVGLDAVVNGAALKAGGDVNLTALGSATVASVQNAFDHDFVDTDRADHVHKATTVRSTVEAGGDVNVSALLGDVTLRAAAVKAGGKVTLAALNGNVTLGAKPIVRL